MKTDTICAPAKINLGLEILGKRDDGFHEIRSVLATICLCDTLSFAVHSGTADRVVVDGGSEAIDPDENLVLRALHALRDAGAEIPPQHIELTKRIPVAAGMGGASSDAATVLSYFAAQHLMDADTLGSLAANLGSDVPFFLDGPVALAAGRGERLTQLPSPHTPFWVVTVSPDLTIPRKTATMFGAIEPAWWSDGQRIDAYAGTFPTPPLQPPDNVFARALFTRVPEMLAIRETLRGIGFPFVAVSGAGPTLFTICQSENEARLLADRASAAIPSAIVHASSLFPRRTNAGDRPSEPVR